MLNIEPKLLRVANAGNYRGGLYGSLRSLLQKDKGLETVGVLGTNILVLDISFYQVTADFSKMLSNGVDGVIIRAGQNLWEDTKAEVFMTQAEQVGLPKGSYWFYDSRKTPHEQVIKWKDVLGNHSTKLMCWADYEEKYGGPHGGWRKFYDFLEACKSEMPDRKFGIYTGYYYWLEHSPILSSELNYFARYPLWQAWYTDDPSNVRIPKPWTEMLFWQKTSSGDGSLYGVGSKEVDMNLFMGTQSQQEELFGTSTQEPPTGEIGMYKIISTEYNMSLRNSNSIFGSWVETIPANTEMIADNVTPPSSGGIQGDEWAHVVSVNGVAKDAWVAVIHNGVRYCTKDVIQEPPTGTLPIMNVSLRAEGYPPLDVEWTPLP